MGVVAYNKSINSNNNPNSVHSNILKSETELGFDFTAPFFNYLGPGTRAYTNLINNVEPVNSLDASAQKHDLEYLRDSGMDRTLSDARLITSHPWIDNLWPFTPFSGDKLPISKHYQNSDYYNYVDDIITNLPNPN